MKKKLFSMSALTLAIIFVCCSCSALYPKDPEAPSDTSNDANKNTYMSIIDLLEGEIEQLKQDQEKSTAEYESAIAELEKQIAELLDSSNQTDTNTEPETIPFTYDIVNNCVIITSYTGNYSVIVIPDTIDGHKVTEISDSVFSGNTKLTSVYVPNGVKKIGWFAFSGCTSLKSVTLPASVEEIGYDAFAYCSKLTIQCASGSYSEKYAKSYGLGYVAN